MFFFVGEGEITFFFFIYRVGIFMKILCAGTLYISFNDQLSSEVCL